MPKKSSISKLDKVVQSSTEESSPLVINPNRQQEILAECDRQGLTLAHLVKTVYAGTLATRTTVDKNGYEHVEADTAARLKATSIGFDLRGETNSKANLGQQTNIIAVIENISVEAKRRLSEWDKKNVS